MELEDAIHTAILTLKVCCPSHTPKKKKRSIIDFFFYFPSVLQEGFEGQMTESNIELGIVDPVKGFRRLEVCYCYII